MEKIGIFYGPEKGSVVKVASLIAEKLGSNKTELILVKSCEASIIKNYNKIIFGISTIGAANWDSEHTDTDWDVFLTQLKNVNWEGKKVAIYNLGDHINYPDHFVDAIGWIYEKLKPLNANIIGFCKTEGYTYSDSEAIIDSEFAGLPLDEDNEPEKTDKRLNSWLNNLEVEHAF